MDIKDIIQIIVSFIVGSGLGWWLTSRIGLEISHKHRVIEEHTKKLHQYVEEHYMKILATTEILEKCIRGILGKVRSSKATSDKELEFTLFYVARVTKLEEEWFRKVGGIILLRNQVGEFVLSRLISRIDRQLFGGVVLDDVDDAKIREQIDSGERLARFKEKISSSALKPIADRFKTGIVSDADLLQSLVNCLRCLHSLFTYEINVCYSGWYRKQTRAPTFQKTEWKVVEDILAELESEQLISNEDSKSYRERFEAISI